MKMQGEYVAEVAMRNQIGPGEWDKNGGGYAFLANYTNGSSYIDSTITQAEYDAGDSFTLHSIQDLLAEQGVCLGLFQYGRCSGAELSLGIAGTSAAFGDQEVAGQTENLARSLVQKKLMQATHKPAPSEGEIAGLGVNTRATKASSCRKFMKQGED